MIVSLYNKCATVVLAIVYLMIKYRWTVLRTLEFINARKVDIEITKLILNQLNKLEKEIQAKYIKGNALMRNDWLLCDELYIKKNISDFDSVS